MKNHLIKTISLGVLLNLVPVLPLSHADPLCGKEINVPGATRKGAQLYLPKNYDSQSSWPLVVLLHGYTASATLQNIYFGLSHRVNERGFILLIPEGTKDKKGYQFWNATDACCDLADTGIDDIHYLLNLVTETKKQYHVNSDRVYLMGHSNGAFMAQRLACEAAPVFAGVVSLAGAYMLDASQCQPSEPVSFLEMHALNDPTIKFDGGFIEHAGSGTGAGSSSVLGSNETATKRNVFYPSVHETVSDWLKNNQCSDLVEISGPENYVYSIPGKDTTVQKWSTCADGTEVALWTMRATKFLLHNPA